MKKKRPVELYILIPALLEHYRRIALGGGGKSVQSAGSCVDGHDPLLSQFLAPGSATDALIQRAHAEGAQAVLEMLLGERSLPANLLLNIRQESGCTFRFKCSECNYHETVTSMNLECAKNFMQLQRGWTFPLPHLPRCPAHRGLQL